MTIEFKGLTEQSEGPVFSRRGCKIDNLKNTHIGIKINNINLGLTVGDKYIIENLSPKRLKTSSKYFPGVLVQETDDFYVFRCKDKYCECFLKIDFAIGNCSIRNILEKTG